MLKFLKYSEPVCQAASGWYVKQIQVESYLWLKFVLFIAASYKAKTGHNKSKLVFQVTRSPKGKDLLLYANHVFKEQRKNADGGTIWYHHLAFVPEPTSGICSVFYFDSRSWQWQYGVSASAQFLIFATIIPDEGSRSTIFIFWIPIFACQI